MAFEKSKLFRYSSRYKKDFEEIELLGEGGFGCVYEVRNKLDGKRYAVKKIKLANFRPDDCLKVNCVVHFNCCLISQHILL